MPLLTAPFARELKSFDLKKRSHRKRHFSIGIIRDGLTGLDDWGTASSCYQWPVFS